MQDKKWHNHSSAAPIAGAFRQYSGWAKTTISARMTKTFIVCSFLEHHPLRYPTLETSSIRQIVQKKQTMCACPNYTLKFPPCNKTS